MAYTPTTDFIALLRTLGNGTARFERMPGMDYVLAALARANLFAVSVSATAPVVSQASTVWVRPNSSGSYVAEASVFLWNAAHAQYEAATPALWSALLASPTYTFATLPAAGTQGRRAFVTDSNTSVFFNVAAGGGALKVPVFDDGTVWRVG